MGEVEIDVFKAQLVRRMDQRWGFEVEGGIGSSTPVKIKSVVARGPAGLIGLKCGDEITEIFGSPVQGLSGSDALRIIEAAGDTLVLTIERKACGIIPPKKIREGEGTSNFYQPLNMTGGIKKHFTCPKTNPFQMVYSRPFNEEACAIIKQLQDQPQPDNFVHQHPQNFGHQHPQNFGHQHPQNYPHAVSSSRHPQQPNYQHPDGASGGHRPLLHRLNSPQQDAVNLPLRLTSPIEEANREFSHFQPDHSQSPSNYGYSSTRINLSPSIQPDPIAQSRSFRVLNTYMNNTEPALGASGLPSARSAALERQKQDRVKVFMPQQYNTPMGIYSAENAIETFSNQASTVMVDLYNKTNSNMYEDFGTDL